MSAGEHVDRQPLKINLTCQTQFVYLTKHISKFNSYNF